MSWPRRHTGFGKRCGTPPASMKAPTSFWKSLAVSSRTDCTHPRYICSWILVSLAQEARRWLGVHVEVEELVDTGDEPLWPTWLTAFE